VTFATVLESHVSAARELRATEELDELLAAQYATATAAWPSVRLAREQYAVGVARCVEARAAEPAACVIRTLRAVDVYLAAACACGDPEALAAFTRAILPTARGVLGKSGTPTTTIDEVMQRLMLVLFVDDPPQIARYAGRGSLRNWVTTIAVRIGLRLGHSDRTSARRGEQAPLLPAAFADPELACLRGRYGDQVREAFAVAFGQLDERQRDLLRQHYVDGMTIDDVAPIYAINRATAARWIASARLAVVNAARRHLADQLGASASEVDSLIKLMRSQLGLSIQSLTARADAGAMR